MLIFQFGRMDMAADLGGYYYEGRRFDLAEKYFSLAAGRNIPKAWIGLGYIWYYGMTGRCGYQEACRCFVRALEIFEKHQIRNPEYWHVNTKIALMNPEDYCDYINAAYKIADMSRDGKYMDKNFFHYTYLIRQLYSMMRHDLCAYKMPEIEIRMADIALEDLATHLYELDVEMPEGYTDLSFVGDPLYREKTALVHLSDAKDRMAERLEYNHFFGNFSVMKKLVLKIYTLIRFDETQMDLYDLYYVLQNPCKVTFRCGEAMHTVIAELDHASIVTCLDGKWFRSADDMISSGRIDGLRLTDLYSDCTDFEIIPE
ncbi:MAG: hypothetical protein ACOYJH_04755 [Anaerovoracaceae bacterium]